MTEGNLTYYAGRWWLSCCESVSEEVTEEDEMPECFGDGARDDCRMSCPYADECDFLADEADDGW
ncbi:MAG: hypothetical protein PHG80_11280 [Methanoregulaceae archaeon]|nr:hypothetical protein [Methanoregulaceae archaeon]